MSLLHEWGGDKLSCNLKRNLKKNEYGIFLQISGNHDDNNKCHFVYGGSLLANVYILRNFECLK